MKFPGASRIAIRSKFSTCKIVLSYLWWKYSVNIAYYVRRVWTSKKATVVFQEGVIVEITKEISVLVKDPFVNLFHYIVLAILHRSYLLNMSCCLHFLCVDMKKEDADCARLEVWL